MSAAPTDRVGHSLVEALVALLVGVTLVTGATAGLAKGRTIVVEIGERAEWLSTVRLARWAYGRDARGGVLRVDDDSVQLRASRGFGVVCSQPRDSVLIVAWEGVRLPNAEKDSARVLDANGGTTVLAVGYSAAVEPTPGAPGPCGTMPLRRIDLSAGEPGALLLEVFEHGGYHLSGGALRYRRPGGNRQPLTVDHLLGASHFTNEGMAELHRRGGGVWSVPVGGRR